MKRTIAAAMLAAALAGPAFAGQCPMLMAQIEEALAAAADLDAETRAMATTLLEEGRALHESGDHAGSEAALMSALEMLGLTQ